MAGLRVDVGDMVDLLSKTNDDYMVTVINDLMVINTWAIKFDISGHWLTMAD